MDRPESLIQTNLFKAVISILDGDTIEVLHNNRAQRIHLPQSQRHSKERHTSSFVRMGRRTFWRAILRHMETIKSEPRSLRKWQRRDPG